VRECYEEEEGQCDGGVAPVNRCTGGLFTNTVYLSISNATVTAIASTAGGSGTAPTVDEIDSQLSLFENTFVLENVPGICHFWQSLIFPPGGCPQNNPYSQRPPRFNFQVISRGNINASFQVTRNGVCEGWLTLALSDETAFGLVCQGSHYTGTATTIVYQRDAGFSVTYTGSFDWDIST
jgi:hypothetical protein